jgi:hypothetical protein
VCHEIKIFFSVYMQTLISGLYNRLKGAFRLLVSLPGDPRGVRSSHFSVRILPHDFGFCLLTGISAKGPQERSETALRPDSRFWAPYASLFPGIGKSS